MPLKVFRLVHPREALWMTPFLCISLIALGLIRPLPRLPAPTNSRIVLDDTGKPVQIAVPFRGVAIVGSTPDGYLEDTHAPELLMHAGDAGGRKRFVGLLVSAVYPEILTRDSLWDSDLFKNTRGPYVEMESLLTVDAGVFLGYGGYGSALAQLRAFSLPALSDWGHQESVEQVDFSTARMDSALIGNPELGEARIAMYRRALADLERELRPSTVSCLPRTLTMGASVRDKAQVSLARWRKYDYALAGLEDATNGWSGRGDDAERVLAINPDIIFLSGASGSGAEGPYEFMHDPRWSGLKAVASRRVYKIFGIDSLGGHNGLTFSPVEERWMAEIGHPDRLQPEVRQLARDRMFSEFGYRLNDDQIDYLLRNDENASSLGTERFNRNYQPAAQQGMSK